jgi:hypothetical protein
MFKKIFPLIFVLFNALFLTYLLIPTPTLKDLPRSVKSDEPGDTVQMENVTAFYTNLTRTEVINFYRSVYTSPVLIRLNYPPEYAKTIFRDTMQSYYLEEFSLPFKESLYINGYEWENDVFTKPEKRVVNKMIYKGIEYKSKISLKIISTSPFVRILNFIIIQTSLIGLFYLYRYFKKNNAH